MREARAFPSERKQVSSEREKKIDPSVGMEGSEGSRVTWRGSQRMLAASTQETSQKCFDQHGV